MKPVVSPKELAQAIGVSESSLKRWADDGLVRVSRTAGGHRRIAIADAIRFIRETRSPLVDPTVLGLVDVDLVGRDVTTTGDDAERFFRYLIAGRAREARGLILRQYLSGISVADICDGPVRLALARIGELWHHDESGVFLEHRATDICMHALHQLRAILEPPEDAPFAVGGAPNGDLYAIPSLVASLVLNSQDLRTANLGPQTPPNVLLQAALAHQARLVWMSVSIVTDAKTLAREIDGLAVALPAGTRLVIGGRAHHEVPIVQRENVYVASSLGALAAFVRGLTVGKNSAA